MTSYQAIGLEIIIIIGSYTLQIFPRLWNRYYGIDTWRWLLYADEIRKNKGRLPKQVDKYIVPAPFNAPPLLLVFLAKFFSRQQIERYNFLINPFFNIIENLLLFSFVILISGSLAASVTASFIFALIPADVIENTDLNMRALGKLCYQCAFVSMALLLWKGDLLWGLLFAGAVGLVLLAHRMSTQFLFLSVLTASVVMQNIQVALYFACGVLLALVLSRGFYIKVFINHVSILRFWWKHQKQRFANMITGEIPRTSLKSVAWIFAKRLVGRNPYLFFLLPLIGFANSGLPSRIEILIQATILLALAMAVLTTFVPGLIFLGEGYRYIGFVSFQVAMLIGVYSAPLLARIPLPYLYVTGLAVSLVLSLAMVGVWLYRIARRDDKGVTFSMGEDFQDVLRHLESHGQDYRFMSVPPMADDAVAYFSKASRVAFHDNGVALLQTSEYYPVIKNFSLTLKKYKINYCLLSQQLLKQLEESSRLKAIQDNFQKILHENERYVLYQRK